jgi:hypothetical protein
MNPASSAGADADAPYSGAHSAEYTLVPGEDAKIGATRFDDWLSRQMARS